MRSASIGGRVSTSRRQPAGGVSGAGASGAARGRQPAAGVQGRQPRARQDMSSTISKKDAPAPAGGEARPKVRPLAPQRPAGAAFQHDPRRMAGGHGRDGVDGASQEVQVHGGKSPQLPRLWRGPAAQRLH